MGSVAVAMGVAEGGARRVGAMRATLDSASPACFADPDPDPNPAPPIPIPSLAPAPYDPAENTAVQYHPPSPSGATPTPTLRARVARLGALARSVRFRAATYGYRQSAGSSAGSRAGAGPVAAGVAAGVVIGTLPVGVDPIGVSVGALVGDPVGVPLSAGTLRSR